MSGFDLAAPTVRRPRGYRTVEVPFIAFGNERALTPMQLAEHEWLREFFVSFRHCFEYDHLREIYLYRPHL